MTENVTENKKETPDQNCRGRIPAFYSVVLALAVVSPLTRYVLCYCCGYYQTSFGPMFWNYLLAMFGFLLLLSSFVIWVASLFRKRQRLYATITMLSLLALAVLNFILPSPHDLVLYGLRSGMLQNFGTNEMRKFAADFDKLPVLPTHVLPNSKIYENHPAIHELDGTGLKEKYSFLANCESISQSGDVIWVSWGGFENHWGFVVTTDGKAVAPSADEYGRKMLVSDDICFWSDY